MKNKEKNFISAVVYVRNAADTVEQFITEIYKVLHKNFLHYEIILVNDASEDETVSKIKDCVARVGDASVSILTMSYYQGKELSMNAGRDLSIGDFVYEFDSTNMDYDVNLVWDAYKKSLEGYDVVNVVPNSKRKMTSKLFYAVFNKYSHYQYKLDTDSFKIVSRRAINRIHQINKMIPYRKATFASSGLKLGTIYYQTITTSSIKLEKQFREERVKNAIDALILFTNVSYRIATHLIFLFMLITIGIVIYTIYVFLGSTPIEGWTTTMLFLSFGFLALFSLLAIIIKYLSLLVNLIFKKTDYLIENIEKLN